MKKIVIILAIVFLGLNSSSFGGSGSCSCFEETYHYTIGSPAYGTWCYTTGGEPCGVTSVCGLGTEVCTAWLCLGPNCTTGGST